MKTKKSFVLAAKQKKHAPMKTKRGVVAIIFSRTASGELRFLLMHRVLNWKGWEFVKGGIDKNETPEHAVLREAREETGLKKLKIFSGLSSLNSWVAGDMKYLYRVFLLEADMREKVKLQTKVREHDSCKWLAADKVLARLTHKNNKQSFRKALQSLMQTNKK